MRDIIYYPGFEIQNEDWLKFALLYLKDVYTIVPPEGDKYLSGTHRFLLEETDLLRSYRPAYDDIIKSTDDAIWSISQELERPVRPFGILGEIDIIDYWRQPQNQTYELFQAKYTDAFERFCEDWGFAHRSVNGIKIPYQLAITYMSILAHNIGDNKDMSVITDFSEEKQLRRINEKTWRYNKKFEEIKAIEKLISLELPKGLKDIPLRSIVKLRNKEGFQRKLKEFQSVVSELSNIHNINLTQQNVDELRQNILYTKESLKGDIVQLGTALSTTILGVYIVLSDGGGNLELIKELFGLGVLAGVPGLYGKSAWNKRLAATRYLTDIKKLDKRSRRNASSLW